MSVREAAAIPVCAIVVGVCLLPVLAGLYLIAALFLTITLSIAYPEGQELDLLHLIPLFLPVLLFTAICVMKERDR